MLSTHQARQRGFTLIELVVVIVIIGILAAFAIPRFSNIATDARISTLRGLAGTVRSTSALVHGIALARNVTGLTGTVLLEDQTVSIRNGYADATGTGIERALTNTQEYTITSAGGVTTFQVTGATTPANCSFTYTAAAPGPPVVPAAVSTPIETGC